jgi:hypothetical protein
MHKPVTPEDVVYAVRTALAVVSGETPADKPFGMDIFPNARR